MYVLKNKVTDCYYVDSFRGDHSTNDINQATKFETRTAAAFKRSYKCSKYGDAHYWSIEEYEEPKPVPLLKAADESEYKKRMALYCKKNKLKYAVAVVRWDELVEAGVAEKVYPEGYYWVKWSDGEEWTIAEKGHEHWYGFGFGKVSKSVIPFKIGEAIKRKEC